MNKRNEIFLLRNLFQLGKYSVIIPVSLTAFTGFFLYDPIINYRIILVSVGVLLQGMSASGLNQVQENLIDARMERTRNRPIPSGRINRIQALVFVFLTLLTGSVLVYLGGNLMAMLIGIFTLFWYNAIYTPLKKITPFAVVPGSLTGALPPVIGWTAAGGAPFDITSVLLAFLFFMGQVPHFWLLILKYGEQYKNAGLPSLTNVFNSRQINNLSFIWIMASLISALMLGVFGILNQPFSKIILVLITISGILAFRTLINRDDATSRKKYFLWLNIYYLTLMILLIVDKIAAS